MQARQEMLVPFLYVKATGVSMYPMCVWRHINGEE